jgi:hypothetical protein
VNLLVVVIAEVGTMTVVKVTNGAIEVAGTNAYVSSILKGRSVPGKTVHSAGDPGTMFVTGALVNGTTIVGTMFVLRYVTVCVTRFACPTN